MRSRLLAVLATLLVATAVSAAGWGGITPGETRQREVEARYGRPSRERSVTEGGLTGAEWAFVGDRAPRGLDRMVVGFGLVGPQGFTADLVRVLTLYPKPRVFTVASLTQGWGKPDAIGTDEQTKRSVLRYDARAILVFLDRSGEWAEVIVFAPEGGAPSR
jgi:hypothetical protein